MHFICQPIIFLSFCSKRKTTSCLPQSHLEVDPDFIYTIGGSSTKVLWEQPPEFLHFIPPNVFMSVTTLRSRCAFLLLALSFSLTLDSTTLWSNWRYVLWNTLLSNIPDRNLWLTKTKSRTCPVSVDSAIGETKCAGDRVCAERLYLWSQDHSKHKNPATSDHSHYFWGSKPSKCTLPCLHIIPNLGIKVLQYQHQISFRYRPYHWL